MPTWRENSAAYREMCQRIAYSELEGELLLKFLTVQDKLGRVVYPKPIIPGLTREE